MKSTLKILSALLLLLFMSSFSDPTKPEFIGTYGVSDSDPSEIKLVLNADQSFYYQDFSNPAQKIIAKGHWSLKGKKVLLIESGSNQNFHKVWTFEKEGRVAKSRKSLCFYTLCKQ